MRNRSPGEKSTVVVEFLAGPAGQTPQQQDADREVDRGIGRFLVRAAARGVKSERLESKDGPNGFAAFVLVDPAGKPYALPNGARAVGIGVRFVGETKITSTIFTDSLANPDFAHGKSFFARDIVPAPPR